MNKNVTEHKTQRYQQFVTPVLILIATGIVAYAAITITINFLNQPNPVSVATNSDELPSEPKFYFTAQLISDTATPEQYTYVYDTNVGSFVPFYDSLVHNYLRLFQENLAVASVFNSGLPQDSISGTEDDFIPAVVDVTSGMVSYLATPPGYLERAYSFNSSQEDLVYMHKHNSADMSESSIDNWAVVVYNVDSLASQVISGGAYPSWISETEIMYLRTDGFFIYNIETAQESPVDTPFTDYTIYNEVAYKNGPDGTSIIALLKPEANELIILSEYIADDISDQSADRYYEFAVSVSDPETSLHTPVFSSVNSDVAVIARTYDADNVVIGNEVRIYELDGLAVTSTIPLAAFVSGSTTLVDWR
jgi:hypothetical protein